MAKAAENKTQVYAEGKQCAAGLANGTRAVKRRTFQPCHYCRARKVRCDFVESGSPCTNCRLDLVSCYVSDSKTRRKSKINKEKTSHFPKSSADESMVNISRPQVLDDDKHICDPTLENSIGPSVPSTDLEADSSHHMPHMLYQRYHFKDKQQLFFLDPNHNTLRTSLHSYGQTSGYFPSISVQQAVTLPRYVRALPPTIQSDDIEYLQMKGAFTIPEVRLRNELLKSYVQYIHPYLPLLDLEDFLTPIEQNDSKNIISLLLFQAVMFAGTAYIDVQFLHASGFKTRKAARKFFFQRAQLLYDFDYETDRIALVQAILLMTYWYETPDSQKDTWHWIGVSISLAQAVQLHRDPARTGMEVKGKRLWKRIWWSCFMRDGLIALAMRRPTHIKYEDCDVPMLAEEDFETKSLPLKLVHMLGGCPAIQDTAQRVSLARLCIEMTKLCLCISNVLCTQYSVSSHKFGSTVETTMMLFPKKAAADTDQFIQCNNELEQWYEQLEPSLQYFAPGTKERTNTSHGDVIYLHQALLAMVYLTISSTLHRPQMSNLGLATDLRELSRKKVREAAIDVAKIARDLYTNDLVRYLPNTGVTVLVPAIIIYLLEKKSANPVARNASLRGFCQCMLVLERLREMYVSADLVYAFLEATIHKTNINKLSEKSMPAISTPSTKNLIPSTNTLSNTPDCSFTKNSNVVDLFSFKDPEQNHPPSSPDSLPYHELDAIKSSSEANGPALDNADFDELIDFNAGADMVAEGGWLCLNMGME